MVLFSPKHALLIPIIFLGLHGLSQTPEKEEECYSGPKLVALISELDSCLSIKPLPNATFYDSLEYTLNEKIKYLNNLDTISKQYYKKSILLHKHHIYKQLRLLNWDKYSTELNNTILSIFYAGNIICPKDYQQIPYVVNNISGKDRDYIIADVLHFLYSNRYRNTATQKSSLITSANFSYRIEHYEVALIYYHHILETLSFDDKHNLVGRHNDIGLCYQQIQDTVNAVKHFNLSIFHTNELLKNIPKDSWEYSSYSTFKTVVENNLMEINLDRKNKDEISKLYSRKKLQFALRTQTNRNKLWIPIDNLLELAKFAILAEHFDDAKQYTDQIDTYLKTRNITPNPKFRLEYAGIILQNAIQKGNLKQIDTLTKRYNTLKEEYYTQKKNIALKLQDLERNFIVDLFHENKNTLQRETSLKQLLEGFLGVLALVVLVLINNYYKLKKAQKLSAVQKKTIENSLKNKELLLKEVHHRVKNNMQLMASFARVDYRKNASFDFRNFENRILSLALVHNLLYESDNLASISFKAYIKTLIENIKTSLSANQLDYIYDIEDINLNLETAISIGLLMNELITNTIKYNHNSMPGIRISFYKSEYAWHLQYADNGTKSITFNNKKKPLQLIKLLIDKIDGAYMISAEAGFKIDITFKDITSWNK